MWLNGEKCTDISQTMTRLFDGLSFLTKQSFISTLLDIELMLYKKFSLHYMARLTPLQNKLSMPRAGPVCKNVREKQQHCCGDHTQTERALLFLIPSEPTMRLHENLITPVNNAIFIYQIRRFYMSGTCDMTDSNRYENIKLDDGQAGNKVDFSGM